MPTLGATLQEARARKKVKINQVEADTKIDRARLQALESDNYGDLPDDVYTKGAIRNYALYLGLNPDEMLSLYRQARPAAVATRPLSQAAIATRFTPLTYITAGVLVAILLTVALFALHVI